MENGYYGHSSLNKHSSCFDCTPYVRFNFAQEAGTSPSHPYPIGPLFIPRHPPKCMAQITLSGMIYIWFSLEREGAAVFRVVTSWSIADTQTLLLWLPILIHHYVGYRLVTSAGALRSYACSMYEYQIKYDWQGIPLSHCLPFLLDLKQWCSVGEWQRVGNDYSESKVNFVTKTISEMFG